MLIAGYAVVVATAPTVHGIETEEGVNIGEEDISKLQQHLPFTVLKPSSTFMKSSPSSIVATAPTVHGIETYTFWFNQI